VISVGLGQCFEFRSLAVDQEGQGRCVISVGLGQCFDDFCWFGSVFSVLFGALTLFIW